MFFVSGMYEHSPVPLFTTFRSLCSFPITTNGDEIFKSMSQSICWTGSAKATHLLPVHARLWSRLRTACEISTSLNSSNFSDLIPSEGVTFFYCRLHQTTGKRKAGLPLRFYRTLQRHQGRPKPPQGIFWRFQGHPRQLFLICNVPLMYSNGNLFPLLSLSEIVSCEIGHAASLLYCKTWNDIVLPALRFSFSTGIDLSNVLGWPLVRFSEVLNSARWM